MLKLVQDTKHFYQDQIHNSDSSSTIIHKWNSDATARLIDDSKKLRYNLTGYLYNWSTKEALLIFQRLRVSKDKLERSKFFLAQKYDLKSKHYGTRKQ